MKWKEKAVVTKIHRDFLLKNVDLEAVYTHFFC